MKSSKLSATFIRIFFQIIINSSILLFYVVLKNEAQSLSNLHIQAMDLSNELLITSKNMMNMARSYIMTGDIKYKQHYDEMDRVIDGGKARYANYYEMQTFVNIQENKTLSPTSYQKISLINLIEKLDLRKDELVKLKEASENSEKLEQIDNKAIKLFQENHSNKEKIINMLYDKSFHSLESSITPLIIKFHKMLDKRINKALRKNEVITSFLKAFFAFFALILLFLFYRLYKTFHEMLGGSIGDVHTHILHLSKGDFSESIKVSKKYENSILGWLSHTQNTLKTLIKSDNRLKNFYAALSYCNQAIIKAQNEKELFDEICRHTIQFTGVQLAWFGILDEKNKTIKPLAYFGEEEEYLDSLLVSYDPNSIYSNGPICQAIITQEPYWCQDFLNTPKTSHWHNQAKLYGWASSAAFPLKQNGKIVAIFSLYSKEERIFDEQVKKLLKEMISNINYALDIFENNKIRKKIEERNLYLANSDVLTGLPNRTNLNVQTEYALKLAKRDHKNSVIMFLDLDKFKDINDTLGHSIGDLLLVEASICFKSVLREVDIIARLGGDEFVILFPNNIE